MPLLAFGRGWLFLMMVSVTGGIPETLVPILKLPLFACVVGAAITPVAMEYFLFGFDNSSALKKTFWFCVLLFPPLGPPLYCFIVYSRSEMVQPDRILSALDCLQQLTCSRTMWA